MGGVWCGGLNGIRRKCREFHHDDPKISSESEKYGVWGMIHVLGLETRILFFHSLGLVHGWRFIWWFDANSSIVSKMSMPQVQKCAGWPSGAVFGLVLAK